MAGFKFTKNSAVVRIWVNIVKRGEKTLDEVPELLNLKEIVTEVIESEVE